MTRKKLDQWKKAKEHKKNIEKKINKDKRWEKRYSKGEIWVRTAERRRELGFGDTRKETKHTKVGCYRGVAGKRGAW